MTRLWYHSRLLEHLIAPDARRGGLPFSSLIKRLHLDFSSMSRGWKSYRMARGDSFPHLTVCDLKHSLELLLRALAKSVCSASVVGYRHKSSMPSIATSHRNVVISSFSGAKALAG